METRWGLDGAFGGSVSYAGILGQEVQVLSHYAAAKSGKLCDALRIGGDLGQQAHSLEVPDVAVHGFFGVPGLAGNPRCVMALEVESHNLSLVGDVT